ncbi:MAG: ABC transporter substrate-binding protein [candidate division NC10 bacterium]|nr:ABC transporter substrate-binding protein [candidate division NC10 bacterium]
MRRILVLLLAIAALVVFAQPALAQSKDPIKIGLAAAVSGGSAASGEAIKRGILAAMDEVNAKGGLLGGRKLELVIRDDEGDPAKGVKIARELVEREKAVVVFGGLHTTVALAQVPVWTELKHPYMGPWAAGTEIAQNTQKPNYVFRVSANDDYADKFLVRHATEVLKKAKPGLLLENTAWGQSNEVGLNKWLGQKGIKPVGIEKFNWGDPDMSPQLLRLKNAGADLIIMVANAPEGAQVVKSRAKIGWEIPMVAHWGISGGRFAELTGDLSDGVAFLQTYSFFGKQNEHGEALLKALKDKYGVKGPEEVIAPVGTANAYDGMHLVALAIAQAGSDDGAKVRDALENLKAEYEGLIKNYKRPFTPEQHDALTDADYIMVVWKGGKIVPVAQK